MLRKACFPALSQTRGRARPTLTVEEALHLQVSHAEAQHRQLVQPVPDLLAEGQQAGELVQLPIKAVAVAFGRVGLGAFRRWGFGAAGAESKICYSFVFVCI